MKKALIGISVLIILAAAGGFYLYSQSVPGFWTVDGPASSVVLTTVKNGDIAENHYITGIEGEADFNGTFKVVLDLDTIQTGVDIRNERMRDLLFETKTFPEAIIEGDFAVSDFDGLPTGDTVTATVHATLGLHGVRQEIDIPVIVTRVGWKRVSVSSAEPVLVEAADYNLDHGITVLQGLAGLGSISPVVPVTFHLEFEGAQTPK